MSLLKICKDWDDIKKLVKYCKKTKYCSFDFETTGVKFYGPEECILIMGVSFQPGISWIVPLGHPKSPFKKEHYKVLQYFNTEIFSNKEVVKVAWNMKFEYKWLLRYDIILKGRLFDAMLAKYCLDEERPHGLKPFVENFFPKYAGYQNDIKATDSEDTFDWVKVPYDKLCKYCGIDADLTLKAMIIMEPKLIKGGFYPLFRNLLMGITRVLAESEYRGVLMDRPYLEKLVGSYSTKIDDLKASLRGLPEVVKFEKNKRKKVLKELVNSVRLEIDEIQKEIEDSDDDAFIKRKERLINTRNNKIQGYYSGKFNQKEAKKLEMLNFGSPAQLIEFLYTSRSGLRLPILDYTKDKKKSRDPNKKRNPSTAEATLLKLKEKDKTGFIEKLLKFRELEKMDSTYVRGMLPHLDHNNRVHAGFLVMGTVTGRLSSVQPNLQNIPRSTTNNDIKPMFICPPGYVLLEVDYGQAELRIIAEVSKDKAMIDIFKRGYNIHTATACKMFGTKSLDQYDEVKALLKDESHPKWLEWTKNKKTGKSMNFSIVYQQGDAATAEQMGISEEKARKFKKEWFDQFPGVKKWIRKQKEFAHKHEYVRNMFGRKRRLSDINDPKDFIRAESERQAVNAPIQGSSGDFALFSQVVIREEILKGNLPRDLFHIYTVHDSIGYYIKPKHIKKVVPILVDICSNPQTKEYFGFELKYVTMKMSPEIGINWGSLHDYNEEEDYTKLLTT